MRIRYTGKTPYVPVDIDASLISYPQIVLNYNMLGSEKLGVYSQGDLRIDKKWNFNKTSFNFYIEVQNFLAQPIPRPKDYGLKRNEDGTISVPREIVQIDTNRTETPFPSFGFVFDF